MQFDEFLIRKLALGFSVAGLLGLFITTGLTHTVKTELRDVDDSLLSKKVSVTGFVVWRAFKNNTLLFELEDIERIKAVKFSPTTEELAAVRTGELVKVEGRVERYKGELEIVAEKIARAGGVD